MYSRIFKSVLMLTGKCSSECLKKLTASNNCQLFSKSLSSRENTYFGALKYSTDIKPPNKNEVAQKKIEEYRKDPENEKHWKVLELEIEVLRQNGDPVPEKLEPKHWLELIQLESRTKRRRYLDFLFGIERKKENIKEKKRVKAEEFEEILKERENNSEAPGDHLEYRLGKNSPFLRIYDARVHYYENWRLMRAMMFGQKIVMDCGYEDKMTRAERRHCARQLMLSFAANREDRDPFDLHYCNFNTQGDMHYNFHAYIPSMYEPDFPMNLTSKSYLDLFDKERLVYLTPDCNYELKEFDHDAVYIIGAIVDKSGGEPLSLAKAKKEGLKMAKLPIDRYLHFGGGGGKCLTLNQMISIMLDAKNTNDWAHALRHVPRRKLFESRQKAMEGRVRKYLAKNERQAGMFSSSSPSDFSIEARKKSRLK